MSKSIPAGLCQCGCGQRTAIARYTWRKRGMVKGEPLRYVSRHNFLKRPATEPVYAVEDRGHETPCWIWLRARNDRGYGQLRVNGKLVYAHRYFFEQAHGIVLPDTIKLHHLCEQQPCMRHDHLEPLTHGQHMRGHAPKLGPEQVAEMEGLYAAGWLIVEIAERFGVHRTHVGRILKGEKWAA